MKIPRTACVNVQDPAGSMRGVKHEGTVDLQCYSANRLSQWKQMIEKIIQIAVIQLYFRDGRCRSISLPRGTLEDREEKKASRHG